jgi:hypothetical protein
MTSLPWTPLYTQATNAELDPTIMSTYALAMMVVFTVFVFSLEHMLDHRQERAYKITEFPELLEETVSKIDQEKAMQQKHGSDGTSNTTTTSSSSSTSSNDNNGKEEKKGLDTHKPLLPQLKEKFTKAQAYGLDKISFGMFSSIYNLIETVAFLLLGFLPYIWDYSVKLGEKYFGYNETDNEIKITLIFMLVTTIIGTITSLPFELVRFRFDFVFLHKVIYCISFVNIYAHSLLT